MRRPTTRRAFPPQCGDRPPALGAAFSLRRTRYQLRHATIGAMVCDGSGSVMCVARDCQRMAVLFAIPASAKNLVASVAPGSLSVLFPGRFGNCPISAPVSRTWRTSGARKRQEATGKHASRDASGRLSPVPTVPEGPGESGEAVAQAAALVGLGRTARGNQK